MQVLTSLILAAFAGYAGAWYIMKPGVFYHPLIPYNWKAHASQLEPF